MINFDKRQFLQQLFNEAVQAADPISKMRQYLPPRPKGRTIVVGAGKGVAQMAVTLEHLWNEAGYGELQGAVVTRYGYSVKTTSIEVFEASHPIPDQNGLKGALRLIELLKDLREDDLVIALICGGGSALLPAPLDGLTLDDEISLNEALLKSGAPIGAMNTIRKHLSRIKGGRLAAMAAPARVVSFIVSDIPGDIISQVASGPTVPDKSTRFHALDYIRQYNIVLPPNIINILNSSVANAPLPEDPVLKNNEVYVVASAAQSLEASARYARSHGVNAVILSDSIEGEAKDIAMMHAAVARHTSHMNEPFKKPVVILSGGETTVTIKELCGKGGRNSEFVLSFAIAINGEENICALAADTDGIDGSENNAGAFCDGNTFMAMKAKGYDPTSFLMKHDSWTAFHGIDSLFVTGPTGTNINDFRAIFVE